MSERPKAAAIQVALIASPPRFNPGKIVMTPGAVALLANNNGLVSTYLVRHVSGDWGDVDKGDGRLNDRALKDGSRIFSVYRIRDRESIWVITDAVDTEQGESPTARHVTTVLLPEEY